MDLFELATWAWQILGLPMSEGEGERLKIIKEGERESVVIAYPGRNQIELKLFESKKLNDKPVSLTIFIRDGRIDRAESTDEPLAIERRLSGSLERSRFSLDS